MSWIEITTPAVVLNTPHFEYVFGGITGTSIPLNEQGHPYHFEFVALKGMQFEVIHIGKNHIVQIRCPSYSENPLYLDERFCKLAQRKEPVSHPLNPKTILNHMEKRIGTPYVWGGNWAHGIPEMLLFYPPAKELDGKIKTYWQLQGLDCSGLLFEATDGETPRNTSHLLQFGRSLLPEEWVQPLDMILYPGHVLFVRDQTTIIESKFPFGVRVCSLKERIHELSQQRTFVRNWHSKLNRNGHFTIRRFVENHLFFPEK